ncbi:hypothetical protein [Peribacillus simplex]|uniref:hypothetical protein n=1 Tax=Peribacillus simplex TaxID=1478 RepID=UPI003D279118
MGLDVLLYDKDDNKIEYYEITETLHNEIFNSKKLWRSYLELRKLSDYYLSDEEYIGTSIMGLIDDLKRYKMFITQHKKAEYQEFIDKISKPNVKRISIAGD